MLWLALAVACALALAHLLARRRAPRMLGALPFAAVPHAATRTARVPQPPEAPADADAPAVALAPDFDVGRGRHRAELDVRLRAALGGRAYRTAWSATRGVWQAWHGARSWERAPATHRAEDLTELGAMRRLLNLHGAPRGVPWLLADTPPKRLAVAPSSLRSPRSTPRQGGGRDATPSDA
jgi:hypothetical protein